jgi:hypothetical protein
MTRFILTIALLALTACNDTGTPPSSGGDVAPDISAPATPAVPSPTPSVAPSPAPSPTPSPNPAPSPAPQPTVDPLHACAGFAALGTWVNMHDATDILVFNDDCSMTAVYCNEKFNYALPPTASLTHANIDFPTDYQGSLDSSSTWFQDHASSCQPANHINQQNRDMYYSPNDPSTGLPMPAGSLEITWRYNGAYVYQKVQ